VTKEEKGIENPFPEQMKKDKGEKNIILKPYNFTKSLKEEDGLYNTNNFSTKSEKKRIHENFLERKKEDEEEEQITLEPCNLTQNIKQESDFITKTEKKSVQDNFPERKKKNEVEENITLKSSNFTQKLEQGSSINETDNCSKKTEKKKIQDDFQERKKRDEEEENITLDPANFTQNLEQGIGFIDTEEFCTKTEKRRVQDNFPEKKKKNEVEENITLNPADFTQNLEHGIGFIDTDKFCTKTDKRGVQDNFLERMQNEKEGENITLKPFDFSENLKKRPDLDKTDFSEKIENKRVLVDVQERKKIDENEENIILEPFILQQNLDKGNYQDDTDNICTKIEKIRAQDCYVVQKEKERKDYNLKSTISSNSYCDDSKDENNLSGKNRTDDCLSWMVTKEDSSMQKLEKILESRSVDCKKLNSCDGILSKKKIIMAEDKLSKQTKLERQIGRVGDVVYFDSKIQNFIYQLLNEKKIKIEGGNLQFHIDNISFIHVARRVKYDILTFENYKEIKENTRTKIREKIRRREIDKYDFENDAFSAIDRQVEKDSREEVVVENIDSIIQRSIEKVICSQSTPIDEIDLKDHVEHMTLINLGRMVVAGMLTIDKFKEMKREHKENITNLILHRVISMYNFEDDIYAKIDALLSKSEAFASNSQLKNGKDKTLKADTEIRSTIYMMTRDMGINLEQKNYQYYAEHLLMLKLASLLQSDSLTFESYTVLKTKHYSAINKGLIQKKIKDYSFENDMFALIDSKSKKENIIIKDCVSEFLKKNNVCADDIAYKYCVEHILILQLHHMAKIDLLTIEKCNDIVNESKSSIIADIESKIIKSFDFMRGLHKNLEDVLEKERFSIKEQEEVGDKDMSIFSEIEKRNMKVNDSTFDLKSKVDKPEHRDVIPITKSSINVTQQKSKQRSLIETDIGDYHEKREKNDKNKPPEMHFKAVDRNTKRKKKNHQSEKFHTESESWHLLAVGEQNKTRLNEIITVEALTEKLEDESRKKKTWILVAKSDGNLVENELPPLCTISDEDDKRCFNQFFKRTGERLLEEKARLSEFDDPSIQVPKEHDYFHRQLMNDDLTITFQEIQRDHCNIIESREKAHVTYYISNPVEELRERSLRFKDLLWNSKEKF